VGVGESAQVNYYESWPLSSLVEATIPRQHEIAMPKAMRDHCVGWIG